MRVAAGAIAKKYLRERLGVTVRGYLAQLGPLRAAALDWDTVETNPFFCPDAALVPQLEAYMQALHQGGRFDRRAHQRGRERACRRASASRCSTASTPTSRTR